MANQPDKDLAEYIEGQLSSRTLGSDLYWGPVRAPAEYVSKEAAFFTAGAGPQPIRSMGQPTELLRATVLVTVRSGTHSAGESFKRDIMDAIRGASISGYQDVFNQTSEAEFADYSDSGLLLWAWPVRMTYEKSA